MKNVCVILVWDSIRLGWLFICFLDVWLFMEIFNSWGIIGGYLFFILYINDIINVIVVWW